MNQKPKYVMISSEIRRDLEQPIQHMRRMDVYHLYNRAPWKDMKSFDFRSQTARFLTPLGLYWQLRRIRPDIIQGPEPFSLLMFPYLLAVLLYLIVNPKTKLVTLTLEPLTIADKYHPLLVPIFRAVLTRWFKRASIIFWYVPGTYEHLLSYDAPKEKLVNLLYGCWGVESMFRPDGPRYEYPKKPVILYLGRLTKVKGLDYLLEAFKQIRDSGTDAHLALIGGGKERSFYEEKARSTGYADDITFYGTIKNADLPPYLRGADVFVLPSIKSRLWVEQLGTSGLQAMASGVPCVVSDTPQLREFYPSETSILVPERDPEALAKAIMQLLSDPQLRASMGKAAVSYVQERFDSYKNVVLAERAILDYCGYSSNFESQRHVSTVFSSQD